MNNLLKRKKKKMKEHFKIYLQITTQIHEPIAHRFRKCIKKKKVKNETNWIWKKAKTGD